MKILIKIPKKKKTKFFIKIQKNLKILIKIHLFVIQMLAMSAQGGSVLMQNPLGMTNGGGGGAPSSFSAQEVQALQHTFQQQTIQQLALLQQSATASQFSPQAQFYLQSHVIAIN